MKLFVYLSVGVFWLSMGCAHAPPTFTPEVGAVGTKFSHGGVVHSVPLSHPVLKVKLVSAGVTDLGQLSVRMYFLRKGPPQGEYLNSKEVSIVLPGGAAPQPSTSVAAASATAELAPTEVLPLKVHASGKGWPLVRLVELPKQAVEFLFPLPPGEHRYPSLELHWKLHYFDKGEEKVIAQQDRFDLDDPHLKTASGVNVSDVDFPYEEYSSFPADSDWIPPGWMWW